MRTQNLIVLALLSATLPLGAQNILGPLSISGDFDGTVTDDRTTGGTFSGWLNSGNRTVAYGSNAFARAAGASDQFIRIDHRRRITLDTGYATTAAGESYDFSFYTIAAAATVAIGTDTAQLTLYYTADNSLSGTVTDQIDFIFAPTSTTSWDFSSTTGASFTSDPGAGKNLYLEYTVNSAIDDAHIGIDNISLSLAVVPEQSSFALLAGFFGLTWIMLRRR